MRSYRQLTIYVAREFALSFTVAFLFFFFIFFINQMLLMAEQVLTKRVGAGEVLLLILYQLPAIIALSFPFASLVGALMAIGRYASENEVIAFLASGIPLPRILAPILILGLLFSSISFVMNDYFLPLGNINFARLYRQLIFSNPSLELEPYSVKRYQNTVIVTGAVDNRTINDLLIIDRGQKNERRVITATRANLTQGGQDSSVISLNLDNVLSVSVPTGKPGEYDYSRARRMVYNILLKDISLSVQSPSASEMSSVDLYALIRKEGTELDSRIAEHRNLVWRLRFRLEQDYAEFVQGLSAGTLQSAAVKRSQLEKDLADVQRTEAQRITSRIMQINQLELNKKFAIPFACVIFTLFAFPVALFARRSGRAVGFGIGVLVSAIYWMMLLAGITVGSQQDVSPVLAMWMPDIFFLVTGSLLLVLRLRR